MLTLEIARDIRIALPKEPRHISTYVFLEQENWFEDEADFVGRAAEPGGRMLDIGASFGFYGLSYARAAGPAARVWSFEPTPAVCTLLRESIRLNDFANMKLVETAVGAEKGRCRLISEQESELNSVNATRGSLDVAMASLDSMDAEHEFGEVDFVKLDVEGHESAVVSGGTRFFTRRSPLIMLEVKAARQIDFSASRLLENLGYSLYRLVPELGVLVPFRKEKSDSYLLNIFACKPDRAARLAGRGLLCLSPDASYPIASVREVGSCLQEIPALADHSAYFENWLAKASGDNPVLSMLRQLVTARNPGLSIVSRCTAWHEATCSARRIVSGHAHLAASLTAARVLRGWGERGLAVETLGRFLPAVLNGTRQNIDAPFFPPLAAFEHWTAELGPWLKAGIVESCARWSSFSSYWGEPMSVPCTELLARFGRQTSLLERRRQLRRILTGQQMGPEPHPLLATRTPDNLNPAVWSGQNG